MLVRFGGAPDSVPSGQRIVRAQRILPALPRAPQRSDQERAYEAYVHDEPASERADARRACAAYQAAELIQPRPGLIIRVRA